MIYGWGSPARKRVQGLPQARPMNAGSRVMSCSPGDLPARAGPHRSPRPRLSWPRPSQSLWLRPGGHALESRRPAAWAYQSLRGANGSARRAALCPPCNEMWHGHTGGLTGEWSRPLGGASKARECIHPASKAAPCCRVHVGPCRACRLEGGTLHLHAHASSLLADQPATP